MLIDYCVGNGLKSLDLFSSLVEDSPDFVYTKDRQFRYLSLNAAAVASTGRTREEIIGHDDFFLFPAEEARGLRAVDTAMLADGLSRTTEETISLNGELRRLSTTKHVFRSSDGHIMGLVGISRDITDLHNAQIALREAMTQERARRAEIATMMEAIPAAVVIAHDPPALRETDRPFF